MQLNKDDIIIGGENCFSVFCIIGSVVYVNGLDVNSSPGYKLEEVLKHYRKIEIMNN